jgi:hypothetical protein
MSNVSTVGAAPRRPAHIEVVDESDAFSAQARTYAEYRVFAALARHSIEARTTRVILAAHEDRSADERVSCVISIATEPAGRMRIKAYGRHPYAAINLAVDRIALVAAKPAAERVSS